MTLTVDDTAKIIAIEARLARADQLVALVNADGTMGAVVNVADEARALSAQMPDDLRTLLALVQRLRAGGDGSTGQAE